QSPPHPLYLHIISIFHHLLLSFFLFFFLMLRLPPRSTLFPYTTLFRSSTSRSRAMWVMRCGALRTNVNPAGVAAFQPATVFALGDRKSTRLNSSHVAISYAVFCLKKKKKKENEEVILYKTY